MSVLDALRRNGTSRAPLPAPERPPGPVAGIDIGGTKIATLIVDADGAVLGRATHASSVGDQGGAVPSIAACLDEALGAAGLQRHDLQAVGVGVPGRVDPQRGHVTLAVNLGWTDFALRDALELELGVPVVIENDVRAAAIGLHDRGVDPGRHRSRLPRGRHRHRRGCRARRSTPPRRSRSGR